MRKNILLITPIISRRQIFMIKNAKKIKKNKFLKKINQVSRLIKNKMDRKNLIIIILLKIFFF